MSIYVELLERNKELHGVCDKLSSSIMKVTLLLQECKCP